jgi:PAS domain S-box-containing protein
VLGHALDVTELHRAQREIRRASQERMFRALSVCCPVGIFQTTAEGRCVYLNPRCQAIVGGKDWNDRLHPEDREGVLAGWQEATRCGRAWSGEFRLRPDGDVTPWVRVSTSPQLDERGRLAGHVGVVEDVTERRSMEEQLRQSQKMEAVGKLAGGVAHDFNNILTAIGGYTELLLERLGPGEPMRHDLEEIRRAVERAADLTCQLLAFSRRQILQPKVISLNDVLADLNQMLRRVIGEDIVLRAIPAPDLRLVRADPGQIEQVILNLALNARDAMPQGGSLTVETANAAGSLVMLAVTDTGVGMEEETQARLFEPFFTTKLGRGTGLGLSIVKGIVQRSGGHLTVASQPGRGATFRIYLPAAEAGVEVASEPVPARPAAGGSETILLVEDEESVRALVRGILAGSGYVILEARDGRQAEAVALAHSGPIHLLLTDVVMPGRSGYELFAALAPARHAMRALFMSGYNDKADSGGHFLPKPFTKEVLLRKVREVLDQAQRATIGA